MGQGRASFLNWVTSKWESADLFFKLERPDLWIAIGVFIVGLVCSEAYNLWLGRERTFVAKLFDCAGEKLDESFFGAPRSGGARNVVGAA